MLCCQPCSHISSQPATQSIAACTLCPTAAHMHCCAGVDRPRLHVCHPPLPAAELHLQAAGCGRPQRLERAEVHRRHQIPVQQGHGHCRVLLQEVCLAQGGLSCNSVRSTSPCLFHKHSMYTDCTLPLSLCCMPQEVDHAAGHLIWPAMRSVSKACAQGSPQCTGHAVARGDG